MLQITAHSKISLAIQPIDFRRGIDGIAAVCKQTLSQDPMSGVLFIFRNRLKTMIRILCFDGQGFWLCTKRLSSGRFKWWPNQTDAIIKAIDHKELYTLIHNGNPVTAKFDDDWKPITV